MCSILPWNFRAHNLLKLSLTKTEKPYLDSTQNSDLSAISSHPKMSEMELHLFNVHVSIQVQTYGGGRVEMLKALSKANI